MNLHHIKITSPDGRGVLTTVSLDGEQMKGVSFVGFAVDVEHNVVVTLALYADVEFEGEAEIIKHWRNARPRGLRGRLHRVFG